MIPGAPPRVLIIGGGIAGLSAAWHAEQLRTSTGLPLHWTLVERAPRLGGKIKTDRIEGFVIEGGPDSFLAQKPWAAELARQVGIGDQIMGTNEERRKVFVLQKGRLVPLPDGVMLIVPTRFLPFATSPLISPLGKLRMAMDLFIPPRRDGADETLAEFIQRRLGEEALDKIAEPLMSGIHNAESDRQSILATFPRFRQIEAKHGSLIRGMLAARRARAVAGQDGASTSPFQTLRDGMEALVDAVVARLPADRLVVGRGVAGLERTDASTPRYRAILDDGRQIEADAVILAVPAYVAADLVRPFAPELARGLAQIRYVSTGTISLAFREADLPRPLDGFGFVIPRSEKRQINACTWTSSKFRHRAPNGYALLRVFFGGSRHPELMELDDAALIQIALNELRQIMGVTATPVLTRVFRWPQANPQYDVGHLDRVAQLEASCPPGVFLTGSAYRGVGVPDCVRQGRQALEDAAHYLNGSISSQQEEEKP
ncbi:MAG: protoporphyrinogen oxidase [Anaerolineae bacterium]